MAKPGSQTMDFFAHQDAARRTTSRLVFLFVLAVALIIVAVYFAVVVAFVGITAHRTGEVDYERLWYPWIFAYVAGGTLLVVLIGASYKMSQLRGGGSSVATLLGGRPVLRNTNDPDERRLVNVVEEVAIASGTPVPPIYVLEGESGINAFAAGFTISDAVVAVTSGCMKRLTRDELQGVIAHEFSHILNGDMRLNIRLMGVLNGILVLAIAGYVVLRLSFGTGRGRSRSSKGSPVYLALFGVLLMIIGYVGVFFSKLIKSAVSRQREFLADASAVQFTRNPAGIAGALSKIGGFTSGSRLASEHAEEASHLFFANGLRSSLLGLMATHPPLKERIRRIDPGFDGAFDTSAPAAQTGSAPAVAYRSFAGAEKAAVATPLHIVAAPEGIVARVGAPRAEDYDNARRMVRAIPEALSVAASDPFGASAVIYALLSGPDDEIMKIQHAHLLRASGEAILRETKWLTPFTKQLPRALRLPLVDLAIPSLRAMSANQYAAFVENVGALIKADQKIDLFEYLISRMIERHLAPTFRRRKPSKTRYTSIASIVDKCGVVLSCLAHYGSPSEDAARQSFERGAALLGVSLQPRMTRADDAGLTQLDSALDVIVLAAPSVKRRVIEACAACVVADGRVTVDEAEFLRAVGDALDCPIPPLAAQADA